MSEPDKYLKDAEALVGWSSRANVVAARLRSDGAEIERLKEHESDADALRELIDKYDRDLRVKRIENDNLGTEISQLRAQLAETQADPRLQVPLDGPGSHRMDLAELRLQQEKLAALHGKIMNLPVMLHDGWKSEDERYGYKIGHRDARHQFAEIVAGLCAGVGSADVLAEAEKRGMEKAARIVDCLDWQWAEFGIGGGRTKSRKAISLVDAVQAIRAAMSQAKGER